MGLDQVIKSDYAFRVFDTREDLVAAASEHITCCLNERLSVSEQATLALSGGSTPKPVYDHISTRDLRWGQVHATLVDDRVTNDPAGSNAKMVEDILLQNKASGLNFRALEDVADDLEFNRQNAHIGFDVTVMGMGTDGHTASWFPGSPDLGAAMDPDTDKAVLTVSADGCPGAGIYPERITMTLPTVMSSQNILLLITGEEKRRVFDEAINKSVYDAPVKALLAAGPRLTVMWAP